jgi:protoporphyrinogen oxidase
MHLLGEPMSPPKPVIVGGGPAGLAAARILADQGLSSLILEKDRQVGGLCKTVEHRGFRCDIGGHRFFTKNKEIQESWEQTLGPEFLRRSRLSRIYYRARFFYYPLRIGNALLGLGPRESLNILASYLKSHIFPVRPEVTFEDWVSNRFGKELFSIFFKTYTEKVWGIPCTTLSADWAAQRIRNLSLGRALMHAVGLRNGGQVTSLIDTFHYPRLGPGQMYEAMAGQIAARGGEVRLGQQVAEIHHEQNLIKALISVAGDGGHMVPCSHCFSSMPITELVQKMRPRAPESVMTAAASLGYRSIITVNLLFRKATTLPDNWIYLHSPEIKAGRLQLYTNWSPDMVPAGNYSSIGFEYFCTEGDELWRASDAELIRLATSDLSHLGFYAERDIDDAFVVRYAKAYPVYEDGYLEHVAVLRRWLAQFSNLYCIGRYGQFRYNNMDHSMMTGMLAARRMMGQEVDPWSVNAEGEYLEAK